MSVPPSGGYGPSNYPSGGYQGLGVYSPSGDGKEPKGPKKRPLALIAASAAAVVAIAVTTTILIANRDDQQPTPNAQGNQTTAPATKPPTTAPASSKSGPLDEKRIGPPQVPGWTVVPVNDGDKLVTDKAYDVPSNWAKVSGNIRFGWPGNTLTLFTPAMYKAGFCPAHPSAGRGGAGVTTSTERDGAKAAEEIARKIFELYPPEQGGPAPTLEIRQAQPVTVDRDKKGYTLTARASYQQASGGCGDVNSAAVSVMALAAQDKDSIVFVAYADQGVAGASDPKELQQIVLSLHNVG